MRRWVAAPGTCVIGRGSRLAPQQANEPTDAVAHVESSKAVSSAPPSAAHLEGIEEQSQFVTKVRELSTKVHQRCQFDNVLPANDPVLLSGVGIAAVTRLGDLRAVAANCEPSPGGLPFRSRLFKGAYGPLPRFWLPCLGVLRCTEAAVSIYRDQDLVASQEPGGKRGVVAGPYGIAGNAESPIAHPRLQLQLVAEVASLGPEAGVAQRGHPASWDLSQCDLRISRLGKGLPSIGGRHREADDPPVFSGPLPHGSRHLDLLARWLLGDGRRHRHFVPRPVVARDVAKELPERLVASPVKSSGYDGFGQDVGSVVADLELAVILYHGVGCLFDCHRVQRSKLSLTGLLLRRGAGRWGSARR